MVKNWLFSRARIILLAVTGAACVFLIQAKDFETQLIKLNDRLSELEFCLTSLKNGLHVLAQDLQSPVQESPDELKKKLRDELESLIKDNQYWKKRVSAIIRAVEKKTFKVNSETAMKSALKNIDLSKLSIFKFSDLKTFVINKSEISTLPNDIGNLEQLTTLDLSNNKKLTTIPASIGRLKKLQILNVAENENLAELPVEISACKNLEELYIDQQVFQSLPEQILKCKKLHNIYVFSEGLKKRIDLVQKFYGEEYAKALVKIEKVKEENGKRLDLSGLQLASIPPEIKDLDQLEHIIMTNCGLKVIPPEIFEFTNLKKLWVGRNQLIEIPNDIGRLVNLEELDVSVNLLKDLPFVMKSMANLNQIRAVKNDFNDVIKSNLTAIYSERIIL